MDKYKPINKLFTIFKKANHFKKLEQHKDIEYNLIIHKHSISLQGFKFTYKFKFKSLKILKQMFSQGSPLNNEGRYCVCQSSRVGILVLSLYQIWNSGWHTPLLHPCLWQERCNVGGNDVPFTAFQMKRHHLYSSEHQLR